MNEQPVRVRSEVKFLAELWVERENFDVGFVKTKCDCQEAHCRSVLLQVAESATFKSPPSPERVVMIG